MKSLIAAASVAAIGALAPLAAQAQTTTANTGAYGNLNYNRIDGDGVNLNSLGGRLGYRFNDWIGVEGEAGFGVGSDEVSESGVTAKAKIKHHAAVYGVGFFPVATNTDLIARLGYGTTKAKVSAAGFSESASNESWNYGVGVQHHFDGKNGVRLDWTRTDFEDGGGKANVWTIGYSRKF